MRRQGAKPIYVSIGHMVTLQTAINIELHCSKSSIPEPLRLAHGLATKERIKLTQKVK